MRFIPSFHFVAPSKKLTPEWCQEAIDYLWHNVNNVSLVQGKDVKEINDYSEGDWDMTPFKRIFRSIKKQMDDHKHDSWYTPTDTTGLDWKPLPLIPTKLNA